MKTLIRLLLEEQSDLDLHCLPRPICPKTYDHYGIEILNIETLYTIKGAKNKSCRSACMEAPLLFVSTKCRFSHYVALFVFCSYKTTKTFFVVIIKF